MPQAKADPEEIRSFANNLSRYIEVIQQETEYLNVSFDNLGDTWEDEKRIAFEAEFNSLIAQISRFQEACGEQIPHLQAMAASLDEYLQS